MDSLQADAVRLHIGPTKQFFFDNVIIESIQNVTRQVHSPQKVEPVPLIQRDQPWEQVTYFTCGSWRVIRDPADGIFKCWYEDWQIYQNEALRSGIECDDPAYFPSRLLYAQSTDGLHWEKPALGVRTEDGHDTNIVLGDRDFASRFGSVHSGYVFLDPFAEDHQHRFKILFNHCTLENRDQPLRDFEIAASPDGIRWESWEQSPQFGRWGQHMGDVVIVSLDWASRIYIANVRHPVMGVSWHEPGTPVLKQFSAPYYPGQPWRNNKRRIFQTRSADLINWSEPKLIVVPDDELDNVDDHFYGMNQYDIGGMWVGFLNVFHQVDNTMDVQLLYSQDGRVFKRLRPGQPWLTTGPPGSWDQYMVNAYGGPVQVDDELYIYYGGAKNHHDWWVAGLREGLDVPEATDMSQVGYCLGLAKMKLDRFVSLSANAVRPGMLVTRPFHTEGGKLLINARCNEGGSIQVEVAGGNGEVRNGYRRDDCVAFTGDETSHMVSWKSNDQLPGGWVKLYFYISDADLFTFQVKQ